MTEAAVHSLLAQRHPKQLQLPPEESVWKDISCCGPVVCVYFRRPPRHGTWIRTVRRCVCVCREAGSHLPGGARTNLNLKLGTMALYNKDAAVGFPRL